MVDPSVLIHWIFSWLTLAIIFTRLLWRRIAHKKFNTGDYLSMAVVVCVLARLGLIHVVLIWGTANVPRAYRLNHDFSDEEIYRRTIGSQLALANRVFFNSYLWLQKLVLLDVYRRLLRNLRYERVTVYSFLAVFLVTYIAVQVSTFVECSPITLYWQVVPDPGECARAQVQLFVVGILEVVTDAMLLILPLPILFSMQTITWRRRAQLLVLFTLGIFIIAVTLVRLPINATNADSQVSRTTWASIELLVMALIVNAPTIWGLWNKRGQETGYRGSGGRTGGGKSGASAGSSTIGSGQARTRSGTTTALNRASAGIYYGQDSIEMAGLVGVTESHENVLAVGNTITVERGPDMDEEQQIESYHASSGGLRRMPSTRDGITRTTEVIVTSEVDHTMSDK